MPEGASPRVRKAQRSASPAPVAKKTTPVTPSKPSGGSYLDRLQKEAHASELDYTNTSPRAFLALAAIQLPVILALSYLVSPWTSSRFLLNRYSYMALTNMTAHWFGFGVAVAIGSAKWFDVCEDVGYFVSIVLSYSTIAQTPSPHQKLAYACALLWNARLLAFLGFRMVKRGSDFRFDKLNKAYAYQLFGWTSGGTWCWANGFCLWHVADSAPAGPSSLGLLDVLGLALFIFGLLFEAVADWQKYAFNAAHAAGKNKRWISSGLWARSRHPNYFGETTLWLGLALICMSPSLTSPYSALVCLVTPVWSFIFLLFTSLMLLEKHADAKWGANAEYEKFKAETPVWLPKLPWPKRS